MKKKLSIMLAILMVFSVVVSGFNSSFAYAVEKNTVSSEAVANAKDKKLVKYARAAQSPKSVERVKTDLDLSKLELYQFSLKQENMEILNQSSTVEKKIVNANGKWKESTVFMMKIDKSKGKVDHKFDNPLKLKFKNAGQVNGKQVDIYIDILELRMDYQKNNGEMQMGYLQPLIERLFHF